MWKKKNRHTFSSEPFFFKAPVESKLGWQGPLSFVDGAHSRWTFPVNLFIFDLAGGQEAIDVSPNKIFDLAVG